MKREYNIIIEKDTDGYYIGSVPELKGCHSQAKSIDELMIRMEEVIELCEEVLGKTHKRTKFVGIQKMVIG
jgi:predicted RNase H-like HicB family nuclease